MYQASEPMIPPGLTPPPLPPGQPVTPLAQPIAALPISSSDVNQPIVINQVVPKTKFKTTPVSLVCPFCKSQVRTLVKTQFNCCNCCFCFFFCFLWLIIELGNDKDLNCTDAIHICPNCNRLLGRYKACVNI